MPADMSKYPQNWPEIRAAILERAGNKCEGCGLLNGAYGYRHKDGSFWTDAELNEAEHLSEKDRLCTEDGGNLRRIRIVLTIAHIHDPNPMNCDPDNLKAYCQRCHNRLDAPMRAKHAAETKRRKAREASGQLELL